MSDGGVPGQQYLPLKRGESNVQSSEQIADKVRAANPPVTEIENQKIPYGPIDVKACVAKIGPAHPPKENISKIPTLAEIRESDGMQSLTNATDRA